MIHEIIIFQTTKTYAFGNRHLQYRYVNYPSNTQHVSDSCRHSNGMPTATVRGQKVHLSQTSAFCQETGRSVSYPSYLVTARCENLSAKLIINFLILTKYYSIIYIYYPL